MKIYLTGKPGVGKTTIIDRFIEEFKEPSIWMITREALDREGRRVGFVSTTSNGLSALVSHKTDIDSDVVVGSNRVDVVALKGVIEDVLGDTITATKHLIILDEIGPIQLTNPDFMDLFHHASDNDILATLHTSEERLGYLRDTPAAIHLHVTLENRTELPDILQLLMTNRSAYNRLDEAQQLATNRLIEAYIDSRHTVQLKKLMMNAIPYVLDNKLGVVDANSWTVEGDHGSYIVTYRQGSYSCVCDLYLGKNGYEGAPGECSHIQAVKLSLT